MKYFKIKDFKDVVSRDKIINCIDDGFYIINLDDSTGPGTHWVAMFVKPKLIGYFDSYGLYCPAEVIHLSDILGVQYIYIMIDNIKTLIVYYVDTIASTG